MSAFVSTMRFVGDLDNEFYDDEHQRDVWNEASAIGFQLCLWTSAVSMAVLPWVAGDTGAWVTAGLFVAISVISLLTLAYSKARRVDVQAQTRVLQPRSVAIAVLYFVGAVGVVVQRSNGVDPSTMAGMAVGGVLGAGAAAFFTHRAVKQRRELDAVDEDL